MVVKAWTPNVLDTQLRSLHSKNIDEIHYMVLTDRWWKVREIVKAIGISYNTINHKRDHVKTSKECLAMFNRNSDAILRHKGSMDLPQHTGDQKTVETVGFSRRIGTEES